jgi:Xaa-Pro dipeptidase
LVGLRGAVSPKAGLFTRAAEEVREILTSEGVAGMPLGIDVVEPPFLFALQQAGVEVRDGQQVMLEARMIKSQDELVLLNMAAAMVDGVYQDIFEALKPGVRSPPGASTRWAPTAWRRSTRSPASAAARTRTTSPTA